MMKTSEGRIPKSCRASMSLGRSLSLIRKFVPLYLKMSEVIMSRDSMDAEKKTDICRKGGMIRGLIL